MPAGQKPAARARHALGWLLTPPQFPPFRPGTFRSRTHDPAPAAWLGIALGVAFGVCFVTGMLSHLIQSGGSLLAHDVISGGGWRAWPTAWGQLYRVTQGLHVTTGRREGVDHRGRRPSGTAERHRRCRHGDRRCRRGNGRHPAR